MFSKIKDSETFSAICQMVNLPGMWLQVLPSMTANTCEEGLDLFFPVPFEPVGRRASLPVACMYQAGTNFTGNKLLPTKYTNRILAHPDEQNSDGKVPFEQGPQG